MQDNQFMLYDPPQAQMMERTVVVEQSQPRDDFVWSLCNLIYCNPCCLGLIAVYYSIKSRDRKMVGDLEGARNHGQTARCYNIVILIISLIMTIGIMVLFWKILEPFYTLIAQIEQNTFNGLK
ncbi:hypothetical protein UPYG_G00042050 [Umbra pygmaea]|uniref:Interferon-induced transmembrane protein n=1 Tax=Umbra pygmaea TaxID=75934 RepID=A0ABD0XT30_UMBPY